MTVTLHVFSDNSRVILLGLLDHYLVFLRANVIRLDHTQLLLHSVPLLSDMLWRNHVFAATWVLIFHSCAILTCRKLAVLWHTDRVLVQWGLHQEFTILNADARSTINTLVLETGIGSCHRVLCSWVTHISTEWARRLAYLLFTNWLIMQVVILFSHLCFCVCAQLKIFFLLFDFLIKLKLT